jgi:hypothetical protein
MRTALGSYREKRTDRGARARGRPTRTPVPPGRALYAVHLCGPDSAAGPPPRPLDPIAHQRLLTPEIPRRFASGRPFLASIGGIRG